MPTDEEMRLSTLSVYGTPTTEVIPEGIINLLCLALGWAGADGEDYADVHEFADEGSVTADLHG